MRLTNAVLKRLAGVISRTNTHGMSLARNFTWENERTLNVLLWDGGPSFFNYPGGAGVLRDTASPDELSAYWTRPRLTRWRDMAADCRRPHVGARPTFAELRKAASLAVPYSIRGGVASLVCLAVFERPGGGPSWCVLTEEGEVLLYTVSMNYLFGDFVGLVAAERQRLAVRRELLARVYEACHSKLSPDTPFGVAADWLTEHSPDVELVDSFRAELARRASLELPDGTLWNCPGCMSAALYGTP